MNDGTHTHQAIATKHSIDPTMIPPVHTVHQPCEIGERVMIAYRVFGLWVGTVTEVDDEGMPSLIEDECYGPVHIHKPVVSEITKLDPEQG